MFNQKTRNAKLGGTANSEEIRSRQNISLHDLCFIFFIAIITNTAILYLYVKLILHKDYDNRSVSKLEGSLKFPLARLDSIKASKDVIYILPSIYVLPIHTLNL